MDYDESADHPQNIVMTPYKGSMLGGTVVGEGEESAAAGMTGSGI